MKNLIEMAVVDGHFDDTEYDLLKRIAKKYKVSERQLKKIQANPDHVEFEVPKNKNEKFNQLFDLVHMMTADNLIEKEEVKLCNIFAIKFGYDKEKVDELVDSIKQNIINGQNRKDTRQRLQWMLG